MKSLWIYIIVLHICLVCSLIYTLGLIKDLSSYTSQGFVLVAENIKECSLRCDIEGERTDELWEEIFSLEK